MEHLSLEIQLQLSILVQSLFDLRSTNGHRKNRSPFAVQQIFLFQSAFLRRAKIHATTNILAKDREKSRKVVRSIRDRIAKPA